MNKWIYSFGAGSAEGNAKLKNLLGGKGSNLAEMNNIGVPVPPGFTITTEVCNFYYSNKKHYPSELNKQLLLALENIEKINEAFKLVSKNQSKKILEVTSEKLVSIDFNHNSASAIVDSSLTNVVGGNMGKISAWYDNEWGFSNRMCDIAEHLHQIS